MAQIAGWARVSRPAHPRYTCVRDLNGPWLLYENESDPFEKRLDDPALVDIQAALEDVLQARLRERNDFFFPSVGVIENRVEG